MYLEWTITSPQMMLLCFYFFFLFCARDPYSPLDLLDFWLFLAPGWNYSWFFSTSTRFIDVFLHQITDWVLICWDWLLFDLIFWSSSSILPYQGSWRRALALGNLFEIVGFSPAQCYNQSRKSRRGCWQPWPPERCQNPDSKSSKTRGEARVLRVVIISRGHQ